MAAPQASSRLEMLQARFQQKQLQEKEQKLLQLYDQQQQRAYQVVQRGSAGSNSSNHGSTITQHTVVSKTSTASTSQGGKVRQMFDERRQTTVKGIDRSYPLEPLENKPRKQTNGTGAQKNGNLTVNRQSVTVKRVTRADVNSNLNGGKPVVSYHEEITRESFAPAIRQQGEEDEFGNENHVGRYSNGNHRDDPCHEVRIEEIIDQDTMERNRMMAKLHLMEFDESGKRHAKNDLESEQFPEDLMVDVPDRVPKRTVTKKLSQAEARLERFKNANAKRNNVTKTVPKKRSDPLFPAKSTSREGQTRIREVVEGPGKSPGTVQSRRAKTSETVHGSLSSFDAVRMVAKRRNERPHLSGSQRSTPSLEIGRTPTPESTRSVKRARVPEFFCTESEKSATTFSLKPNTFASSLYSAGDSSERRNTTRSSSESVKTGTRTGSRTASPEFSRDARRRSSSPQFFCKETERGGTTMRIKPTIYGTLSPEFTKDMRRRNVSPRFFSKETERGGSNARIKPKIYERLSPEFTKGIRRRKIGPRLFSEVEQVGAAKMDRLYGKTSPELTKDARRSASPQFFCRESEKSATTMLVTPETISKIGVSEKGSPRLIEKRFLDPIKIASPDLKRKTSPRTARSLNLTRNRSPVSLKDMENRSPSPHSYRGESDKSATTSVKNSRSPSPRSKISSETNKKPEFFCYETEKSATTVSLKPKPKDSSKARAKTPLTFRQKDLPDSTAKTSKSSVRPIDRSSKSPENSGSRRGSANVLRSTKLIRDMIKRQGNASDLFLERESKGKRSPIGSRYSERSIKSRSATPNATYRLPSAGSSPKSLSSFEVDTEIQEITMPDQYVTRQNSHGRTVKSVSTYSKSKGKPKPDSPSTYSVKPGRKRGSLLATNIFAPNSKSSRDEVETGRKCESGVSLRQITRNKSNAERRSSGSRPLTNGESIFHGSKRRLRGENIVDRETGTKRETARSRKQTTSSSLKDKKMTDNRLNTGKTILGESGEKRRLKEAAARPPIPGRSGGAEQFLRSMELVQRAIKARSSQNDGKGSRVNSNEIREAEISIPSRNGGKDYERTDSVESALKRFDSIGASVVLSRQNTSESKKEFGSSELECDSNAISLRALDQAKDPSEIVLRETSLKKAGPVKVSRNGPTPGRAIAKISRTEEIRAQKRFARDRGSMEIARPGKSSSPACKRRLFRDTDSESSKTVSPKLTKGGISSPKLFGSNVTGAVGFSGSSERRPGKRVNEKKSTGASDCSDSVKPLRSIEDIRKCIKRSSSGQGKSQRVTVSAVGKSKSAIANPLLKPTSASRFPVQSRSSVDDRLEHRKGISPIGRVQNVSCESTDSSQKGKDLHFKATTRFSRITKSPSPEPAARKTGIGMETRVTVPSSPSKSPDTVARRPSTDWRVQDTKTRRATPPKGAEPTGYRKTTTTTVRKSTDVVDAGFPEDSLHLRDQTVETKHDDSPKSKKSDAFVVNFDEESPKENHVTPPKTVLLRKQSMEKQTPPGRPISSVSSVSSGSSTQGQASRGRMASRAKTPTSGSSPAKGSGKSGASMSNSDNLVACKICQRRFASDRVSLHEQICSKTVQKKRKQFDTMMYRVRGTELEPFVRKGIAKKQNESKPKKPEVKSNWRRKHEDFINAIRSAKQVQAHLAAGGKLSDLPPPPPSDTSDYIQCPHCGRKFNQAAAERHIPKCENMLHNKPAHSRTPKPKR